MSVVQHTPTNYWVARIQADRAAVPTVTHDWERTGYAVALIVLLAIGLTWAWSPVALYGAPAVGFALFWSAMWGTLTATAWRDGK